MIQSKTKMFTPMITEESVNNQIMITVYDKLLQERIIFLGTPINDYIANTINAQLLYLDSISNDPITMYINSPGGSIYDGLAIYDTMNFIKSDVNTCVVGLAASMGFILAINGKKRSALKNSKLMSHQPLGGYEGQATDMTIYVDEMNSLKKDLNDIIISKTNIKANEIELFTERDTWINSTKALELGIIDKII